MISRPAVTQCFATPALGGLAVTDKAMDVFLISGHHQHNLEQIARMSISVWGPVPSAIASISMRIVTESRTRTVLNPACRA